MLFLPQLIGATHPHQSVRNDDGDHQNGVQRHITPGCARKMENTSILCMMSNIVVNGGRQSFRCPSQPSFDELRARMCVCVLFLVDRINLGPNMGEL